MIVYNVDTDKVENLVILVGNSNQPIIINLNYMQDTTPSNPQEKEIWYNTSDNKIYTYKNNQWKEIGEATVGVWYEYNNEYYLWDGNSLEKTDLNIYEKIENKTDNPNEISPIKYPSSKALKDGLDASFPIIVTDSGSSLPSASGYQLDDTFLNTSDKKIYKIEEGITGYTLATGVTNTATLDTTTGIVSDFYSNQRDFRRISKSSSLYWSGNLNLNIHFKINEVLTSNTYYGIFAIANSSGGTGKECMLMIKDKKLHWAMGSYNISPTTWTYNDILFDYELDFNTEYFLKLKKEGNVLKAELFTGGYNGTQVASNIIATEDWYVISSSALYIGGISSAGGSITYTYINQLLVYLGDTSGDFVVAETGLSWDSGVALTDKTEYADKTNGILYLYENEVLNAIPNLEDYKKKAETIIIDTASVTIANVQANKNYVFSNSAITDITLSGCETSFEETSIEFTTGTSAPTLTDNSGITWVDGSPTFNASKSYLIVIFNKLGFVKEY